ncbi:710_t:CDS:2 [Dentiscutata erythropus]|uniref:710_t:CDS:1 n=1 Tax=Dentiscutata erythropus TaxID=1348616 RepID=A0A9N9IF99_9GLOM|nr:710_t:CDS:2 [Dentiscutata erythropus]
MPSTITTVCYITDRQESTTSKALTIVKAAGVMHLKTSVSPLNVLLVGFFSQNDDTPDQTLATFLPEDVLLIVLHHVIQLTIDLTDLPAFPLLINMTAFVVELSQSESNDDDISLVVETRDFMNQDHTVLKLKCYYLKSVQHLIPTTTSAKKGSTLFMNGELLIDDDYTFIVHLRINESGTEKVMHTIASRVKGGRRKKTSTTARSYLGLKNHPKISDFAKKALNQNQSVDVPNPSTP